MWRIIGLYYAGEIPRWSPSGYHPHDEFIVEDCTYISEAEARQRDLSRYGLNFKFEGSEAEAAQVARDYRTPDDLARFLRESRGGM